MAARKPQNTDTTDGLLKAMFVFARAVDQVLDVRAIAATGESLSQTKVQILRLLGRRGPQTSTRVATFLGVSKPAVTQIVDAMVGSNLLARAKTTRDRREINLKLTAKGNRIFESVCRHQQRSLRTALRGISQRRLAEWAAVLQDVTTTLVGTDGASHAFCLQCAGHADDTCILTGDETQCPYLMHAAQVERRIAAREGAEVG